jgi:hypothetical protein
MDLYVCWNTDFERIVYRYEIDQEDYDVLVKIDNISNFLKSTTKNPIVFIAYIRII